MRTKYFLLGKLELLGRGVARFVFVCLFPLSPSTPRRTKTLLFLCLLLMEGKEYIRCKILMCCTCFQLFGKRSSKRKIITESGKNIRLDRKRLYLYCHCFQGPKMFILRQNDCLNVSLWKSKKSEHKSVLKYSYYQN